MTAAILTQILKYFAEKNQDNMFIVVQYFTQADVEIEEYNEEEPNKFWDKVEAEIETWSESTKLKTMGMLLNDMFKEDESHWIICDFDDGEKFFIGTEEQVKNWWWDKLCNNNHIEGYHACTVKDYRTKEFNVYK